LTVLETLSSLEVTVKEDGSIFVDDVVKKQDIKKTSILMCLGAFLFGFQLIHWRTIVIGCRRCFPAMCTSTTERAEK
jgi:hypothetical protein